MKSSFEYLREKLYRAVHDLSASNDDIRKRVYAAHGRFWTIQETDFPAELLEARREIQELLTMMEAPVGHIIPENIKKMPEERLIRIAELILGMFYDLLRLKK